MRSVETAKEVSFFTLLWRIRNKVIKAKGTMALTQLIKVCNIKMTDIIKHVREARVQKKRWLGVVGGLIFVCMCFGAIGIVFLGKVGYDGYARSPKLMSVGAYQDLNSTYQLAKDQQGYVDENGYPASFSILFYQDEGVGGRLMEIRHETWYYFNPDIKITFVNGQFSAAEASEMQGGQMGWPYRPEMFTAYMTPEQVAKTAALSEWFVVPVEANLVANAEVYYADGLTFGMKDGRLIYIEMFAGE